ncbi:MAG: hypothetical protein M1831_007471 [Alyxoria varia]|nr:MAG: hypothetical protein M1831_007471 [Alyxoria varia]
MSAKQIILITGGNSGVGFDAAAFIAGASPNNHVILCSRSVDKGNQALENLKTRNLKGSLSLLQLDVTSEASISAAAKEADSDFGVVDVLINNAGIAGGASNLAQQMNETFATNVTGQPLVTEAFIELLKKSSTPRLIYVSSGLGSISKRVNPNDVWYQRAANSYRISKAALNMLAACHHVDFGRRNPGIKVWAFCPGHVATNLGEGDRESRLKSGLPSSETSAKSLLEIVEGQRDGDAGKFIHGQGFYEW